MIQEVTGLSLSTVSRCRKGNTHAGRGYSEETISVVQEVDKILSKELGVLIKNVKHQINGKS